MLSWTLKTIWFALSLSGLLACWLVLLSFAKSVGRYWLFLGYCIGCTLLQGIFCIGMVWRMNPFDMPQAFCIAQPIIIGFASVLLSGICTTFAFSTRDMLSSQDPRYAQGPFAWRNIYLVPILVLPCLTTAAQTIAIVKLGAVRASDDLHCDANHPLWVRFLGYAGAPIIISLPGLFMSLHSVAHLSRLSRISKRIGSTQESVQYPYDVGPFTKLPPKRASIRRAGRIPTPLAINSSASSPPPRVMSPGREAIRPGVSSPTLYARQFHLPFSPVDPEMRTPQASAPATPEPDPRGSPISSNFPTFRGSPLPQRNLTPSTSGTPPPDQLGRVAVYEYPASMSDATQSNADIDDWRKLNSSPTLKVQSEPKRGLSPIRWARQITGTAETRASSRSDIQNQYNYGWDELAEKGPPREGHPYAGSEVQLQAREDVTDEGFVVLDAQDYHHVVQDSPSFKGLSDSQQQLPQFRRPLSNLSKRIPRPVSAHLSPAIWRILLFQITFSFVLLLASISTIIDVAASKPAQPSPFGTQHVALLLAAWGPVIVFGHLPAVRQNLKLSRGIS